MVCRYYRGSSRAEEKMNKKQVIVPWLKNNKALTILWIMGIAICLVFLLTPKKYVFRDRGVVAVYDNLSSDDNAKIANPALRWDIILPSTVTILIIGGLLIYTLKEKKK